jgi:hypothetical protein
MTLALLPTASQPLTSPSTLRPTVALTKEQFHNHASVPMPQWACSVQMSSRYDPVKIITSAGLGKRKVCPCEWDKIPSKTGASTCRRVGRHSFWIRGESHNSTTHSTPHLVKHLTSRNPFCHATFKYASRSIFPQYSSTTTPVSCHTLVPAFHRCRPCEVHGSANTGAEVRLSGGGRAYVQT